MADPINYLAGFNPAQSILQSVQAGIAAGGVGGQSKEQLAMEREKMQMQREEFGLSQQLKREQMAQQKSLHEADLALRESQSEVNRSLKDAQIADLKFKAAARDKTSAAFDAYVANPTTENLFSFQTSAAMSHPESVAASTQASKNFAANVGQQVASEYSRQIFNGQQLLQAGKFDEAEQHFKDASYAMKELGDKTQNSAAQTASSFLDNFAKISSESKNNPALATQASVKIGELALGDPVMMDFFKKKADLEKTQSEAKLASAKARSEEQKASGETVNITDVSTKRLLADAQDSGNQEYKRNSSISDILSKIKSGEVKLPDTINKFFMQSLADTIPFFANDVTMLRKQYIQVANSEAVKNLPPGSASNQDVKFAREGIMSADTNKEQFVKGLEAMQRLSDISVKYWDAKSDWISKNGNIGSLSSDKTIAGESVKKGTGFNEWWRGYVKSRDTKGSALEQKPASDSPDTSEAILGTKSVSTGEIDGKPYTWRAR